MGLVRARLLAVLGATAMFAAACGYPDYSGFHKPRGSDASADDAPDDQEADEADVADAAQDMRSEEVEADGPGPEASDADAAEAETAWCTSNEDCELSADGPLCDVPTGRCGQCSPAQDICPPGQYCSPGTLACELGCKSDQDCVVIAADGGKDDAGGDTDGGDTDGGAEAGPDAKVLTCDPQSHACTGCDIDDDCPLGTLCEAPTCVQGCTADHPCPAGRECCGGVCLDTSSDKEHCGGCDTICADPAQAQAKCELGQCAIGSCLEPYADCDGDFSTGCETDLFSSMASCGGCGAICQLANADAQCASGFCVIAKCHFGFADCDSDPLNGCEVQTSDDEGNCGACEQACGQPPHAKPACIGAACEIGACDDGYADCNASAQDGCETPTQANVNSCGGCGVVCSMLHANPKCASGTCLVASCVSPWADCDGLAGNGCEVDVTQDPQHCGTCTNACAYDHAAGVCTGGSCSLGACAAGWGDCNVQAADGCEAQVTLDEMNCGGCGQACSAPHAVPACNGGSCGIATCTAPWGDCNTSYADGCETDLATNPANCGVCGKVCSFPNAAAQCSGGACVPGVCNAGFADCDNDPSNGCEVNTQTSATHCGGCGQACDATNGVPSCSSGQCSISCSSGFADCNHNATDGCEVTTINNPSSCGGCGVICSVSQGTAACNGTTCQVASCAPGWGDCNASYGDGCETQLTSAQDCGLCGNPCAPANAVGSCATGVCAIVSCLSGYEDCDGDPANGCEVNLNVDVNHCGTCPNKCPSSVCTPKCTAGSCGCSTCPLPGTADCDNDPNNGCETTTTTDPANCGGCGAACVTPNGTSGCSGGVCTVAGCNPGWGNCNGVASDGCERNLRALTDCGACDTICDLPHATESCSSGACLVTVCDPGWGDCDGIASNGCETNTASSTASCGVCGLACSSTNGTPTCSAGICGIICDAGWESCDGDPSNGCETNTLTSASSCGACGHVCDATHGTASCSSGSCAIACDAGWGNCDYNASNGCETSTSSNLANCGSCGNTCSSINGTAACTGGVCSIACTSGWGNCDNAVSNGCEANLQTDPLHCNSCSTSCSLAHAVETCAGGVCGIGSCETGWADCDATVGNGCETDTGTGVTNCGACGNICNATNGTPTCATGVCGIICASGWGNCDNNASNGCETSTATSVSSCGSCGNVCPAIPHGTAACIASVCGVGSCETGYHESGGACVPNGEICDNGVDDEGDGRVDCFDTDCLTSTACAGKCMDAAQVGCDTVATGQSTSAAGATQRIAPPSYSCTSTSFGGPEYAYKFTGGAGQNVFVEAFGLSGDVGVMLVDVATGAQCAASTSCSKAGNLSASANPEAIGFTTVAGHDYYIVVDGAAAQSYSLAVQCSGAGCFAARAIQAGQSIAASNALGQDNTTDAVDGPYSCGIWSETGPEAAFIFTPTAGASYRVDVAALTADCDLYVLNGSNCSTSCQGTYSYSDNSGTDSESVTFTATANTSYFLVVDGYAGNTCSFTISVTKL